MKKLTALCVALLIVGLFCAARAQQASSNLEGVAKDDQGNGLPGVEVAAKDTRTGITRAAMTGPQGRYRLSALAPSVYDITFKIGGFKTKTVTGLELFVNQTQVLNVAMEAATVEEQVTVVAESPIIESTKAEVSTTVTTKEVESLPLMTRQFATLALLAPGTTEMDSYDPTKDGMSHFSVGGMRGRAIYYSIDGADSKDNMVGGPVQIFTTEGVEEFSVATDQFKAEYGKSQGTVVTVLTRSGSNQLHGSVFGFLRDRSFRSLDYFEKQLKQDLGGSYEKPKFNKYNVGASIGGPVVRDKTHFFLAFERVQEARYKVVDMYGEDIWNEFKGEFKQPLGQNLFTFNLTHQINSRHSLKLRYGYQYDKNENLGVGGEYAVSNGYSSKNTNHNLMLSHTWIVKPNVLNEARAVYQAFDNRSDPNSTEPTHYFSIGGFGQARNMPQETRQTKYQIRDDLSWHLSDWHGAHDFKFGADYYYMPRLDLLYTFGQAWYYRHVSGTASFDAPIRQIEHYSGDPWRFRGNHYHSIGLFAQDDWRITDDLTLNLGVRWDYNTGLEFDQSVLASVQFLRDYIPGFQSPGLKRDWNNIAPRLGFAWDVGGKGKTVVRGGFGIFYDQLYAETFLYAAAYLVPDPWHQDFYNRRTAGILNPDGSFWQPNDPSNPTNLPPNQIQPGLPDAAIGPEFQYPYTYHYNIGFSHQLTTDFAIDVNYVHTETRGLGKGDEFNRYHSNTDSYTLSNDYPMTIWSPRFLGRGFYNGLYISARKRFSNKFELRANYSLSGGQSTVNYRGTDGWGVTCYVENEPNAPREWGPVDTDERHRLFLSGIFELPYGIQFSSMFRWNTPRPYNIYDSNDPNDDGYSDLPIGVPHRMYGRGLDNFAQFDFRLSKFIKFTNSMDLELMAEVYNAFNTVNFRGYQGDVAVPETFGQPSTTTMPREAQFGVRFRF